MLSRFAPQRACRAQPGFCARRARKIWPLALLLFASVPASRAQDADASFGGSLEARPRLTGDWDHARDELSSRGVQLDVDLLLTPQAVLSGGRSTGGGLWGNIDTTLTLDTQKLGLWQGGSFQFQSDTGFGTNVLHDSGTLLPVNIAATIPGVDDRTTALMNATYTQAFGKAVTVAVGKINTLVSGETEFYGNYNTQFLNNAFNFPTALEQVPLSAWGANLNAQISENGSLSLLAVNPLGTPTTNPIFGDGIELNGGAALTVKPFGLVGHQSLGVSWNNATRYSLQQDPSNIARLLLTSKFPRLANPGPELIAILEQYFPELLEPTGPPNQKSSSWAWNYGFDQYFWQPPNRADAGIGMFFAFGASDGNPNPIHYSYLIGLGGKGVVPSRPDDTFGVGFASTQFSGEFLPFLRERLDLGLERENAFEAYYNAALTGWLNVSADLQVVQPGLSKTLTGTELTSVGTTVVAGLRFRVRF